ncbi:MAG: N-acetylmuramoyl-L-alanine amidase [Enterovirga sp.]|jgi:N-acetylmuramoyl-L-alanine amidase|nr:N-acetylmuramoyl-L-alanine amidase [Enterovirga sp.]
MPRPCRLARLAVAFAFASGLFLTDGRGATVDPPAVAVAADVDGQGPKSLLSLTLSRRVAATAFVLDKPDRVIVDLPEVNFQLGSDGGRARDGLIASLRYGLFAPGRSRVVVELAGPATVTRIESVAGPLPGTSVLQVELTRADRDAFRAAVSSDRTDLVLTTGSIGGSSHGDPRPVIAIDAGHGGVDPGAIAANGAMEKDIAFAFASTLRDLLSGRGRYRVVMIRGEDVFVPLDERVKRAREAGADLLLSVHADMISSPHVSGATIYVGGEKATDHESASLADRENAADAAGGMGAAPPTAVVDILHDLTVRETRGFSGRFAGLLRRDLGSVARLNTQPQREAGFRVLRSPDIPSVLVELGYLSNARDLDLMLSAEWRARTAGAMAAAVDRFFTARLASRAPLSP